MFFELKMKIKSGFSNAPIVMKVCTRLVMIFSDGFGRLVFVAKKEVGSCIFNMKNKSRWGSARAFM